MIHSFCSPLTAKHRGNNHWLNKSVHLVGALEHFFFYFCIFAYIRNNHPNWRTPSFFRGVGSTTNQPLSMIPRFFSINPHGKCPWFFWFFCPGHWHHLQQLVALVQQSAAESLQRLGRSRGQVGPTGEVLGQEPRGEWGNSREPMEWWEAPIEEGMCITLW